MKHLSAARLDAQRVEIEALSLEILRLLNERSRCALRIQRTKDELGLPTRDARREVELLGRLVGRNEGPLDDEHVHSIFAEVLEASREIMRRDAMRRDTMRRDTMRRDTMRRDTMRRDTDSAIQTHVDGVRSCV